MGSAVIGRVQWSMKSLESMSGAAWIAVSRSSSVAALDVMALPGQVAVSPPADPVISQIGPLW